jgi:hypothetical protein
MCARSSDGRNDIPLLCVLDGQPMSNFRLREFQSPGGLVMVHRSLVASLERVRRDLAKLAGGEVRVVVTSGLRTPEDQERLAARLGWTDRGGLVARDSRHLPRHGGIAADIVAVVAATGARVPQKTLGQICRRHFDYVKDDYADGHVHADNRNQHKPGA